MFSEKKKRSDLGLHIFLPKSKCSLKKKKKGLHSESSSEQTSAVNPKLYMLFSRGRPKKGGAWGDCLIRLTQYPPLRRFYFHDERRAGLKMFKDSWCIENQKRVLLKLKAKTRKKR